MSDDLNALVTIPGTRITDGLAVVRPPMKASGFPPHTFGLGDETLTIFVTSPREGVWATEKGVIRER